ncbi:MAG: 2-phosphosulfolactate phosphatase [Planctomycetales bacterium]|nr:2-phosphosulfolactate phosphatase [Planctomycetales bacterium]
MASVPDLSVHYLPQFVAEHELAGGAVVVIDLLRASTTICHALQSGAKDVMPFVEVDELFQRAEGKDRSLVILGGERGGERVEGFDLGNSPAEYTPDVVFGKHVLFTTTNGTRALHHAKLAARVLVGSMANLSRLVGSLKHDVAIHLLCAGTNGHVSREDILVAGAIAYELTTDDHPDRRLNDSAESARGEWQELLNTAKAYDRSADEQLAAELHDTPHGKTLIKLGFERDLTLCAQRDVAPVVPLYDARIGRITAV